MDTFYEDDERSLNFSLWLLWFELWLIKEVSNVLAILSKHFFLNLCTERVSL